VFLLTGEIFYFLHCTTAAQIQCIQFDYGLKQFVEMIHTQLPIAVPDCYKVWCTSISCATGFNDFYFGSTDIMEEHIPPTFKYVVTLLSALFELPELMYSHFLHHARFIFHHWHV